jgi:hypothetical protein
MQDKPRKSKIANSRYEIVFESRTWPKPSLAGFQALGARGGDAIGDAYARIAGSFLDWLERRQDAGAERKFSRRSNRKGK